MKVCSSLVLTYVKHRLPPYDGEYFFVSVSLWGSIRTTRVCLYQRVMKALAALGCTGQHLLIQLRKTQILSEPLSATKSQCSHSIHLH